MSMRVSWPLHQCLRPLEIQKDFIRPCTAPNCFNRDDISINELNDPLILYHLLLFDILIASNGHVSVQVVHFPMLPWCLAKFQISPSR